MTQHQRKIWMKWFIIVGGWTLFGLYMAAQYYVYGARSGRPASWEVLLVSELSYALIWAALTPLVLWLAERFRIERNTWAWRIPIHIGASIGVASTQKILSGMILAFYEVSHGSAFSWEVQFQSLLAVIDYGILLYWLVLLIHYSVEYYRKFQERSLRASQLETQLAQAQLRALRMQLHPHFLFNTLNAISVLIKKDPDLARRTVGRLSDLLRLTLENGAVQDPNPDQRCTSRCRRHGSRGPICRSHIAELRPRDSERRPWAYRWSRKCSA